MHNILREKYFDMVLKVKKTLYSSVLEFLNDILHMSFLAGIHVFKAFPAYTTTEI